MTARTKIGRRALCAAPAALLLPAFGVAAAALAEHPDAALLAVLAALDANSRRIGDYGPNGRTPIHDDAKRVAFLEPLYQREKALIGQLCAHRAATVEGCLARAASLAAWDPDLFSDGDDEDHYLDYRQMAALVRDLAAIAGAA